MQFDCKGKHSHLGIVYEWCFYPREQIGHDTIEQWEVNRCQLGYVHVLH